MAELDYDALTQAYMRLLEERGPGFRGIPYEGAAYTSRDPGSPRMREGQVDPDVGFLDPVDFIAGALAPGARTAVKALGRQLTRPPGRVPLGRPMLRSQRGSLGSWADDPDDLPFGGDAWDDYVESVGRGGPEPLPSPVPPPARPRAGPVSGPGSKTVPGPEDIQAEITLAKERIRAVMDEQVNMHGEYNPDLHADLYARMDPDPGEPLLGYLKRLRQLEKSYNPDQFYGPGEFPESRLEEMTAHYAQTPAGLREKAAMEAEQARQLAAIRNRRYEDLAINPYDVGEGPAKRAIELDRPQAPAQPSGGSEAYADVIRKLFEQGGL